MSIGDNLLRRLDILEAGLMLRKSGVPARITALCYSDKPEDIEAAKRQMLDFYSIPNEEVLEAAGSSVEVSAFPWAAGRSVGITSNIDPAIPEPIREQAMANFQGREMPPIIGTPSHETGFDNPENE